MKRTICPEETGKETEGRKVKPASGRRALLLWAALILLVILAPWLTVRVVLPFRQVHRELGPSLDGTVRVSTVLESLGGAHEARGKLRTYLLVPHWHAERKGRAIFLLAWCGPEAHHTIISFLESSNQELRCRAAEALEFCEPPVPSAVPPLIRTINSSDARLRLLAIEALGHVGVGSGRAVRALIPLLSDADADVRWMATGALGDIGPAARTAVPELIKCMDDDAQPESRQEIYSGPGSCRLDSVRCKAAWSLGKIGPGARSAVPALRTALSHPDTDMRATAAHALGGIGAENLPLLVETLQDPKESVRGAAISALGKIAERSPEALRVLDKLLRGGDKPTRIDVLFVLGAMGPRARAFIPHIEVLTKDKDRDIKKIAVETLHNIRSTSTSED